LLAEIREWQEKGVIGPGVARKILAHLGEAPPEQPERLSRLTGIVSMLGGILIGLGIILWVASNWQGIDRLAKVALILAALVVALGAAYVTSFVRSAPRAAAVLHVIAALVYGAAIFLVGQAYHVVAGTPVLFTLWGAGTLAMGFALPSRGPALVGILALGAALQTAAGEVTDSAPMVLLTLVVFGVLLVGSGEVIGVLRRVRGLAGTFIVTGLIGVFVTMLPLTFSFPWEAFGLFAPRGVSDTAVWGLLALGVAAAGSFGYVVFRRRRSRGHVLEATGGIVISAVAVGILLMTDPSAPVQHLGYEAVPFSASSGNFSVLFNVIYGAAVLWAIGVGLATDRDAFVNIGLVFFGLLVVARYIDLSSRLFDRAVVFVGAGAVLLITALLLDRLRRALARRASEGGR
jgi:uncharacterized membrane protein